MAESADRFLRRPPVGLLRAGVPERDAAVEVTHDDRVVRQAQELRAPAQLLLVEPPLDGHPGQVRDLLDDGLDARARTTRLAIVHGERRDDLALRGENRRRPAGTQRVGQREVAIGGPQRVGGDVLDDDLPPVVRGRSTGSGARGDDGAVDGIRVSLREARGRTVPEAVAVEQQDRREGIRRLLLDQPAQTVQDPSQRIASSDHLEDPFLSREQRFGALAIVDVRRDAIPLDDRSTLVAQGHRAGEEPAIFAVCGPAKARLDLERLAGRDRGAPPAHVPPEVVRVNDRLPARAGCSLGRETGVVASVSTHEVEGAVGPRRPGERRHRLDELAERARGIVALVNRRGEGEERQRGDDEEELIEVHVVQQRQRGRGERRAAEGHERGDDADEREPGGAAAHAEPQHAPQEEGIQEELHRTMRQQEAEHRDRHRDGAGDVQRRFDDAPRRELLHPGRGHSAKGEHEGREDHHADEIRGPPRPPPHGQ